MKHAYATLIAMVLAIHVGGCSGGRSSMVNEWHDIDYSNVYRRAGQRENDSGYTAPSVIGCVDDDLYNCNPR